MLDGRLPEMLRTHPPHIPTEIMRTVVAVAEAGSLTKAAERLDLSQPAVTAQIKRLQNLIGGQVFMKGSNGTTPTELGRLVIRQARRMLDANDQLFYLGGNRANQRAVRIGLSTLFAAPLLETRKAHLPANIFIHADHSSVIQRGLAEGYIDIACFLAPKRSEADPDYKVMFESDCALTWVRSKDFVLSPGAPIPIVTFSEDDWMIGALSQNGLAYRVAFHSPDYFSRIAAVRAGIGLTSILQGQVPRELVEAREYYLPNLPPVRAILCERHDIEAPNAVALVEMLMQFLSQGGFSRK